MRNLLANFFRSSSVAVAIGFMAAVMPAVSFAGGPSLGSIVYDPTNHAENITSAIESVKATSDRAWQMNTQMQQYMAQLKQLTNLNPAVLAKALTQSNQDIAAMTGLIGSLNKTYGDLNSLKSNLMKRFDEAKLANLPWEQYAQREAQRIQAGVVSAVERAAQDRALLERVNEDYEQVREWQGQISNTEGLRDPLQLMNVQLNKVVTQNADVIRVMAQNSLEKQQETVDKKALEEREKESSKLLRQAISRSAKESRQDIDSWKRK